MPEPLRPPGWLAAIGGILCAEARAGHDLVTIGRHGRWKEGSPVLLGYLEDSDRWTDNPMRGVGL